MNSPPASGWRQVELRDLITELDAGVSVNSEDRPIRSGEVGVLKTSCVTSGRFDPCQHKAVIDKDVERVATPVQSDRIIMSRMNTAALVGASAYVERNAPALFLPDRLWQFAGRLGVADSRWLGYVLGSASVRQVLSRNATGTSGSMKNLTKEQVQSLKVLMPPLAEQRKIAGTLKAVDDAIAAGEAVVEQLDRARRDLISTLLLHGVPGRHGANAPWDLGTAPASWARMHLADLAATDGLQTGPFGSQLHASDYSQHGVPVVMPKDLKAGRVDTSSIARVPEPVAQSLARHRVQSGDIIFARRGDIGRCALITNLELGWLCGTGCLRLRLRAGVRPDYVLRLLTLPAVIRWLTDHAVGQTMLNLNTDILGALPVLLPAPEEQALIADGVAAVEARLVSEQLTVAATKGIRAALAEALLAGRVRVRDAA